ncbi:DEAD-box ATP-dependent RNA helicase 10 [Artemisia annua]|uniref:DEAD-box ATP-dependent RNA helicase 10 n=1 Tax=Artemisia annua TaxID=35608 RepID=A0A2U1Q260_ARTAN|nr:DEAD-box ATP-dependent RNA helicase 10 [Artemisia annua]
MNLQDPNEIPTTYIDNDYDVNGDEIKALGADNQWQKSVAAATENNSLISPFIQVLDEADRLLNEDFEKSLDEILNAIPHKRRTYLFSATMTKKVKNLRRTHLRNPVKIEAATKYSTVDTLKQQLCFVPAKLKRLLSCTYLDRKIPDRQKRLGALNKFKAGECNVLICTDVASRGLDIPLVDMVINYEIPTNPKNYIHRVGRTARAGRSGIAISLVNQYDLEWYAEIEKLIEKKLPEFPAQEEEVILLLERVKEAERLANMKIKETGGYKRSRGHEDEDVQKFHVKSNRPSNKKPKRR